MTRVLPTASDWKRSFPSFCLEAGVPAEKNLETYLNALQSSSRDSYDIGALAKCIAVSEHTVLAGMNNGRVFMLRNGKSDFLGGEDNAEILAIAIVKEDSTGITVHSDKTMGIWDLIAKKQAECKNLAEPIEEEEKTMIENTSEGKNCQSAAISKEGKLVVWSSYYYLRFWSFELGREVAKIQKYRPIIALTVSACGSYVISGSEDYSVQIWSVSKKEEVANLKGHSNIVTSVGMSADGNYILSGSRDETVKIWSFETHEVVFTYTGTPYYSAPVAITSDGRYMLTGGESSTVKIWSLAEQKEVATFKGHRGNVISLAVTADGKYVISGSGDFSVKIWSLEEYKEVPSLIEDVEYITSVAITANSKNLITGSSLGTVKMWSLYEKKEVVTLHRHDEEVNSVAVTTIESHIISGSSDKTIKIWRLYDKELEATCTDTDKVTSVAITADIKYILSGSYGRTVKIWSFHQHEVLFTLNGHENIVSSVAITESGKYVISGSTDETVKIWSFDEKKAVATLRGHTNYVTSVAVTADNKYIISGSNDQTVKIWSFDEQKELATLTGHTDKVNSVAVTADNKYMVSGSEDGTVKIWSLAEEKELATLIGHTDKVTSVAVAPNGEYILSGNRSFAIRIWPFYEQNEVTTLTGHAGLVSSVAVSADGKYLIDAGGDTKSNIWSLDEKGKVGMFAGHRKAVTSIAITADAKYAISGSEDKTVMIWSLDRHDGNEYTLGEHNLGVTSVAITADNKYVISGSYDRTVKIWSFDEKNEVGILTGHTEPVTSVAITADGMYVISGSSDRTVKIWSFHQQEVVFTLIGHIHNVTSVAVTADRRYIGSGSMDHTVRIWSFDEHKEVVTFIGHTEIVTSIAFSADGHYVISGSYDKTVKIWSLDEQKEVATLEHSDCILSVAITADRRYIVSGLSDGTVSVIFLNSARMLYSHPHLSTQMPSPPSHIFVSNIPKWISGDYLAVYASNHWFIRPELINSLHISAYFNHPSQLSSALSYGVPLFKSIFGSPVTISLQRSTLECLDCLLQHIISRVDKERSEAWAVTTLITDDLPEILKSDSAVVYSFIKCLLTTPEPQSLPSMIKPISDLPIVITQPFRHFHLSDFDESSESQRASSVAKFFLSLVKWNTAFGSYDSLSLLSALRDSKSRKVMRTPFVKTLLDMKWKQARLLFWGFTGFYSLLLINLVCIIFKYWRLDVLCSWFIFLNALFLLSEVMQAIGSPNAYWKELWNCVDVVRGLLSIAWAVLALSDSSDEYVTLVVVILCFLRGFTYFRCTQVTRVFVFLTLQVIAEMYTFLFILAFSVFTFGLMASVLAEDQQVTHSWTMAFSLLMGNFDESQFKVVQWLVFMAACVFNVIIMLNLLIAILSDAYENAQMTMRENDYFQILEVCFELETMCFWRRNVGEPTVIMSCVSAGPDLKKKEWTGKVMQITKEVKKQLGGMEKKMIEMEEKITELGEKISGMAKATDVRDKIAGMEEKLETIFNARSLKKMISFSSTS